MKRWDTSGGSKLGWKQRVLSGSIGDAYMAAAGIPQRRADHAEITANMALDMVDAVKTIAQQSGHKLEMRIGINTGPVVAGVIGTKKFIYDLWGDTVNTASRMESHGTTGAIHVTQATYEKLKGAFVLDPRGTVDVKGKGPMETWWLRGRKG